MKKQRILNKCNVYTALWTVYYMQGALYERGSIVSRLLLGVLLIFSFIEYVKVNEHYRIPHVLKALNVILFVVSVYGVIGLYTLRGTQYDIFSFWKVFLISFLPVYVYFGFSKEGYLTERWFSTWFFFFLISVVISYYGQQRETMSYFESINSMREDFVNNIGYRFVALIPLIVFIRKFPLKISSLLIIAVFVLLSFKRGAILIGGISVLVLFLRMQKEFRVKKVYVYVMAMLFVIAMGFFYSKNLSTNEYANERIAATLEGDTSGRSDLYYFFWNHIVQEESGFRLLFGYGGKGTMQLFGMMAHNDWLELGIDMGLIGVLLYLIYWLLFLKEIKNHRTNKQNQTCLLLLFVIMFGKTIISMSYSDVTVYLSCVFGHCLASGIPMDLTVVNQRN